MDDFGKRFRFPSSLLIVVLLLAAFMSPGRALAAADTFTANTTFPIDIVVFVPCANGGAGEDVHLMGMLHDVFHVTFTSSGTFRVSVSDNPQGVSGVGLTTGAKYQGTGITQTNFGGRFGFEETFVNNFRIVGQGPGNNFLVHENFHITVNANGSVISIHDNFSVQCK